MQISKIYYQRNFRIGDFQYETIGIGIDINEGEDAKQAMDEAKRLVIEYNAEQNHPVPHIQETNIPAELPIIQVDKGPQLEDMTLEQQIRSCKDMKVLKVYESIVKKDMLLKKAYNDTFSTIQLKNL